ncbi:MAG: hypothetical protein JST32_17360, partial [Bacteroidetes bacterium]|nr:hypothetical protein [Bacteroidota bacterium]
TAVKQLEYTVANTKTIAAAEAKYNLANIEYLKGHYKTSQKTCFDLVKELPNYDYWVAKTFILLADDYKALKDNFQAKATLQSVIDNYKGKDDILPTAEQKFEKLGGKLKEKTVSPDTAEQEKPDTTTMQKDTTKQ